MKNKGIQVSRRNKESDEYYTPEYAIRPLEKHLELYDYPPTIWCPFDTKESNYVKLFRQWGYPVIATHIDDGYDFFDYEPEHYDLIISNPPYSCKDEVLKRLYELDKPYAMLLPIPTLQGQKRFPYMKDIQLLSFDKRIKFYVNSYDNISKNVPYGCAYFCRNFLHNDLILEELERN